MTSLEKKLTKLLESIDLSDLKTEREMAKELGVSLKTLQNRRSKGEFTGRFTFNALGHPMYYRSKMLDATR